MAEFRHRRPAADGRFAWGVDAPQPGGDNAIAMKKLRFAPLVAGALILASACTSGGATQSPGAATIGPSAATSGAASGGASAGALTGKITIWEAYGASGSAEKAAFDKIVGNVKTANPGLTVDVPDVPFNQLFNKFETEAASSGGPDLYIAPNDSLPTEARANLLKDLSSLVDTLKAAPYNISDTAIQADTVDGKLYAIPESMKAVALFYRTDLLPTAPATTDDWKTNAKKLGWVYGANGGGAYYAWGIYGAFGGKILDDQGKCAATTGVPDALKWLQDMKAAGMKVYQNDNDAKADLISGKIGGFIDGPWQSGDLKKALPGKIAVAPGPKGPGGDFQPMAAPDGYYINAASQNADLAVQFAEQMISPQNEQIFVDEAGHIPANTTLTVKDPIDNGFATAIKTGFARPTAAELNNYWGNFGTALVAVLDKNANPTAEVTKACAAMDKANKK
jgi:arabinogalactan oligomer / maltooligosaccharide transport system substrate-binding protein